VGIKDLARVEVSGSMDKCKEAGVRVMMITGDSKATALAIARDVHIFTQKEVDSFSMYIYIYMCIQIAYPPPPPPSTLNC
jgi:magnesium-transporting ATPase (P-type)